MPVVYDIIMDKYKDHRLQHPLPEVIELVSRASKDPTYKKPKFRRCMDEYIANGLYCRRPRKLTPELAAYYETIRKKKMEDYIAGNRKKLKAFKQHLVNNAFKRIPE